MAVAPPVGRTRYSTMLSEDMLEEMRDIAWWERITLSKFVRTALEEGLQAYRNRQRDLVDPHSDEVIRKKKGERYPKRRAQLRPGRPIS